MKPLKACLVPTWTMAIVGVKQPERAFMSPKDSNCTSLLVKSLSPTTVREDTLGGLTCLADVRESAGPLYKVEQSWEPVWHREPPCAFAVLTVSFMISITLILSWDTETRLKFNAVKNRSIFLLADCCVCTSQSVATRATTMKFPNPVPSWLVLKFSLLSFVKTNTQRFVHTCKAQTVTGLPHGIAIKSCASVQFGQSILQALRQSDTCRPLLPVPPVPRNTRSKTDASCAPCTPRISWHPMALHGTAWHCMALHGTACTIKAGSSRAGALLAAFMAFAFFSASFLQAGSKWSQAHTKRLCYPCSQVPFSQPNRPQCLRQVNQGFNIL